MKKTLTLIVEDAVSKKTGNQYVAVYVVDKKGNKIFMNPLNRQLFDYALKSEIL